MKTKLSVLKIEWKFYQQFISYSNLSNDISHKKSIHTTSIHSTSTTNNIQIVPTTAKQPDRAQTELRHPSHNRHPQTFCNKRNCRPPHLTVCRLMSLVAGNWQLKRVRLTTLEHPRIGRRSTHRCIVVSVLLLGLIRVRRVMVVSWKFRGFDDFFCIFDASFVLILLWDARQCWREIFL